MNIKIDDYVKDQEKLLDLEDDTISLALVNRLKARIARRESRLKNRPLGNDAEESNPQLIPAA